MSTFFGSQCWCEQDPKQSWTPSTASWKQSLYSCHLSTIHSSKSQTTPQTCTQAPLCTPPKPFVSPSLREECNSLGLHGKCCRLTPMKGPFHHADLQWGKAWRITGLLGECHGATWLTSSRMQQRHFWTLSSCSSSNPSNRVFEDDVIQENSVSHMLPDAVGNVVVSILASPGNLTFDSRGPWMKFSFVWYLKWRQSDIRPLMVTHTQNSCSAFTHPKCTHTAPGAVGSHVCYCALGAVGGPVPCSPTISAGPRLELIFGLLSNH